MTNLGYGRCGNAMIWSLYDLLTVSILNFVTDMLFASLSLKWTSPSLGAKTVSALINPTWTWHSVLLKLKLMTWMLYWGPKQTRVTFAGSCTYTYSTNKPGSSNSNAPSTVKSYISLAAVCISLFLAYWELEYKETQHRMEGRLCEAVHVNKTFP